METKFRYLILITALSIALGYYLGSKTNTEVETFTNQLVIDSLNNQIDNLSSEVITYVGITDSLSHALTLVDSSAYDLKQKHDDQKNVITALTSDSLVSTLSERYGVFRIFP